MRRFFVALAIVTVSSSFIIGQQNTAPEKTVPAINQVEMWQQVGQQPYELTWVQRAESPHTLVDFEDLKGWKLELYSGAQGALRRSRQQQMWGHYVGEILYSGSGAASRVIARPPKPIPIPGRFDSTELWAYGNRWSWEDDKTTPPAEISILLVDARGKESKIQLAAIQWKQWWLIHRRIPAQILSQMVLPASFTGIELAKLKNREQRYFFCDSLAFYTEELGPLTFEPQPKRNLKPYRGQIAGLNTGPDTLPFPTREETILPSNLEKEFQVKVREVQPRQFELGYEGRDGKVVYTYRPATGALSELTARVNSDAGFRPMAGGGIHFADTAPGKISEGQLESVSLDGAAVKARFRHGARIVEYQLQLWQKSIVLDVWCEGGEATELSFGRVAGVTRPRLITVPYLTYGEANPRVVLSGPEDRPIFTSVWFDWYRTNASEPYFAKDPKVTDDSAEINGGMRYIARTDGKRNDLYERIFITNSNLYEEVLPTIANPPSLRQEEGKAVVWTVTQPETFTQDHERSRRIRSYGLDKIMQHSHEVTWRDEADSFTLRLHAAPQKGGDAMLKWYVEAQNTMGWLQGVYTNYTDFCPTNTNWNPDHVQRMSDGEWRRAWTRNYALKPAKAVEFDAYYARQIKEKFGVKMSYTDVHTAAEPWQYCDYDARVPGAGTMAATFYAYGQLLRNDQSVYGPTQSEGTYQWLYAGLTSGSYGWVYTKVNLLTHPLDVAFELTKIHPLECEYGMGYTDYYLNQIDKHWARSPRRSDYVDLFLATTIAYGNMGWLVMEVKQEEPFAVEAMARSYYMMQQLQQQYAFVLAKTIEYADARGNFQTPSQAHATGTIAGSHLHVVYENGTEVYVNRASQGNWAVKDHLGRTVELPPSGWLVFNPKNGFYEMSALVDNKRIDYVTAKEFEFLDGRGQWTERGNLGATGSVALRQREGGKLELIDIYGNKRIAFQAPPEGMLTAFDAEGKSLGKVALASPRAGWRAFEPVRNGRMYVFEPSQ